MHACMHVLKNRMSLIQRKKFYSCLSPLLKYMKLVNFLICERKSSDRYASLVP